MSAKKRGLGRGLDALLSSSKPAQSANNQQQAITTPEQVSEVVAEQKNGELQKLAIEFLQSVNINHVKTCLKKHLKS